MKSDIEFLLKKNVKKEKTNTPPSGAVQYLGNVGTIICWINKYNNK